VSTSTPFFEARGVTSGSRIEIPYAPWVLWGQPVEQYLRANPFPSNRGDVKYEAWIRIVGASGDAPQITDLTLPDSYKTGDSLVSLPPGYDFMFTVAAEGHVREVMAMRNAHDRLAYLQIDRFSAVSIDSALTVARVAVMSLSWSMSFASHAPLRHDAVLVRSMDKAEAKMEWNAHTPVAGFGGQPDDVWMLPALKPFISLYVEGMRGQSPFYRFLCFFKICQRINSNVRKQFRDMFDCRGLTPPPLNGAFPGDPIAHIAKDKVGVKYTVALAEYQAQYRNAIAHFDPADKLEPFNLSVESAIRTASIVMNWAAYDLLSQMVDAIKQLRSAGTPDGEIVFG